MSTSLMEEGEENLFIHSMALFEVMVMNTEPP